MQEGYNIHPSGLFESLMEEYIPDPYDDYDMDLFEYHAYVAG
jgi:hypothetical protein